MKYKKVMALLISAGLSVSSLSSCSFQPQTALGMEAETEEAAGEVDTDGAEESKEDPVPSGETSDVEEGADTQAAEEVQAEPVESSSPDCETAVPADDVPGEVVEQVPPSDEGGGTDPVPSDENGQESGQEEVAGPQEEIQPGNAGDGSQTETPGPEETDAGDQNCGEAGTGEASSEVETDGNDVMAPAEPSEADTDPAEVSTEPVMEIPQAEGADQDEYVDPADESPTAQETSVEEAVTETEKETETDTEEESETDEEDPEEGSGYDGAYYSGGSYWDKSWYFKRDFRFTQVDKVYGIANASRLARIYEEADAHSQIVGEIPYFALAYVLDEKDGFYYIESGDARGFIPKEDLTIGDYADDTVDLLGEKSFAEADADVEIPDNAAFTFTKTTTQEVLKDKDFAITYMAGSILEYPKDGARTIGEIGNGTLVYILEDADDGWLYVESGDVRGFVRSEMLLTGEGAKAVTEDMGEGTISLAEEVISPEENRSLYYTLASVKPAVDQMGESLCEYALTFEGKLPYVYGGTSLGFGADCSGFTQSIFSCFGINIPRTAEEQGVSGEAVDGLENARPGDIIYYGSGPHVGIYLGDGKVVQCSGNSGNTPDNPGPGPTISAADYMPITSIRRYIIETSGNVPGLCESGKRQDGSVYSQEQLELIWAIVAQEDNGSYEGALAVISSAMNRTESAAWGYCGGDALTQLTAPGQYCYSLDDYWRPRLGGNVPEYVKQAVNDCLVKGIRNHSHTSFRSTRGKTTGNDAVQIGGNWYFGT